VSLSTAQEDAVHAFLVAGSGLAAANVLWSQQGQPRPATTWISALVLAAEPVGLDGVFATVNEAGPAGAEVTLTSRGTREVTLSLQCFNGTATSSTSPTSVLSRIVAAARLPTPQGLLRSASVGLGGFGPVQTVGGLISTTRFEPRATLTARLFVESELTEAAGSIEHVDITIVSPVGDDDEPVTGISAFVVPPIDD
jgi:hypothetical protein